ncbi:MAG: heme-binding domain-containing protein [Acidobacteriota bacterium]
MNRILRRVAVAFGVVLVAIQFVPYGRSHKNPPIRQEPAWNAPETRAIAKRACFDCHSNETQYPWYANVAPISWLTQRDTLEGRRKLNFSEWDRPQKHAHDAAEELRKGEMPLWFYVPLHPEAKLSPADRETLIAGLQATTGLVGKSEQSEKDVR